MESVISIYMIVFLIYGQTFVSCKQCVKYNNCACIFDDGSGMIDLSTIGRKDGTATFLDHVSTSDSNWYSFNPCGSFSEVSCLNVAVCKFDPLNYIFIDAGVADKVSFNYNGISVVVQYQSKDGKRNTFVTLVCNPSATKPSLDVIGETVAGQYYMTLTSNAACPVTAPDIVEDDGGLSTGSVLLIIFFVLLFVYLAAGITFNKVWRDVKGLEVLPNVDMWTSLLALIRDGCAFSLAAVCRKRSVYMSL
ncbi:uncharacterized protein LOC132750682 [Ruditapes philippinarum]|uniref:uncharacterized protein LOC132750682 n=1 Tax=Ruditapes philippinarum TaxID=129788 RepID=UPI00295B2CCD|nr:uncharacterized protein LOC132750682 [Ruditapes philippinarum]